jgi:hypothetical protein
MLSLAMGCLWDGAQAPAAAPLLATRSHAWEQRDTSAVVERNKEASMRREVAIVIVSAIIAVGVIFALFDERVSFTGSSYRAPATQTSGN